MLILSSREIFHRSRRGSCLKTARAFYLRQVHLCSLPLRTPLQQPKLPRPLPETVADPPQHIPYFSYHQIWAGRLKPVNGFWTMGNGESDAPSLKMLSKSSEITCISDSVCGRTGSATSMGLLEIYEHKRRSAGSEPRFSEMVPHPHSKLPVGEEDGMKGYAKR
jgi:hypothetical protein